MPYNVRNAYMWARTRRRLKTIICTALAGVIALTCPCNVLHALTIMATVGICAWIKFTPAVENQHSIYTLRRNPRD